MTAFCHRELQLTEKKSSSDFGTLTLMAKASDAIYSKFVKIMDKYEKGELAGQGSKATDAKRDLKAMKIYYFRHINSMEVEAVHAMLDLVISGEMELTHLEKKNKEIEQLMKVKSAIMGQINKMGGSITPWREMTDRFHKHTGDEQLIIMFGKVCELK